jgi:hypothetical protein
MERFFITGESHTKLYKWAKELKSMPDKEFGKIVCMLK